MINSCSNQNESVHRFTYCIIFKNHCKNTTFIRVEGKKVVAR